MGENPASGVKSHGQALLVFAVAAAAYAQTLPHALVWDDLVVTAQVAETVRDRGLAGLLRAGFGAEHLGYYRPVVLLSLHVDASLARLLPVAYHLTNVLLHAANAALVTLLAGAVVGAGWGALFAGLLFALHPVHVESVAFVSGRTDLWATLFLLLAVLAWVRERRAEARGRGGRLFVAGGAAFLLALLSKEVAFLLPPVLLAWDAVASRAGGGPRAPWLRRNGWWVAVWTVAIAAALAARLWGPGIVSGGGGAPAGAADVAALQALLPRVWLTYARLLLVPWPLLAYYTSADLQHTATGLAAAAGLVGLCVAAARRGSSRAGVLGAVWLVAFFLPVSGIVPLTAALVAERFLYLPSVGLCLAAGGLLAGARTLRPAVAAAAGAVLAAALAGTLLRAPVWRDNLSLFQETARRSPSALARTNVGNALQDLQRPEASLAEYAEAARIDPAFGPAHLGWGEALLALGRPAEAVPRFEAAARLMRGGPEAHARLARERLAQAHYALGREHLVGNRLEEAVRENLRALELRPGYTLASNNLGVAYSRLGRHEEAAAAFRRSLASDPACAGCAHNLGLELAALGRWPEAVSAYEEALRLDPSSAATRSALARARQAPGEGGGASGRPPLP